MGDIQIQPDLGCDSVNSELLPGRRKQEQLSQSHSHHFTCIPNEGGGRHWESKAGKENTVSFLEGREMEVKTVMFLALNPHKGVFNLHKLCIHYSEWINLIAVRNPWLWDRLGSVQDRETSALFIALLLQTSIRTRVWARQFFSVTLSSSLLNSDQEID